MTAADRLAQAAKALETALGKTWLRAGEPPQPCHIIRCDDETIVDLRAALAAYEASKKRCETCGGDGWILVREGADGPAIDTADCPDCASGKETR